MRTELSLCAALIAAVALRTPSSYAGGCMQCNPPGGTEGSATSPCGCSGGDGDSAEIGADCIKVRLGMGHTTPWTGSRELALKVFSDDQSPMVFTPDSLYPIMGYTYKRLGSAVMSDGVTASEVVFSHPNGEPIHFVFREGESLGRPDPGVNVPMDERLQMVDARGWATTHDPVYWDLYENDGSVRRFVASDRTGRRGELVSVTDSRGMVTTPADMGVDLVYGPDGVRQFLTPSRLADVRVVDGGYDVAVYPLGAGLVKDPATGLYPVPDSPVHRFLSVRPENGGKRAVVTLRTGDAEARRYVFDYVSNDWSLTRPDGVREIKDRVTVDSSRARLSKEIRSPDNVILSKSVMNYKWESWGYAMTNKVEGFGGVTRTTSWTYYTSGGGTGKVKTSLSPTGLLTEYAYDSAGRETSVRRSGLDMMAEVTTYSYTSVDPSDIVPPVDTRPRTVVKTLDGIECERTYYVYSPLTNIVERVGTQGAPYGSTNALRTITAFYPTEVGAAGSAARVGKIKSIRREDGRLDLYDYMLANDIWTETVTHLHEQSPAPVSGKTTRDTTLTNRRGETVERKTEAFIDGTWHVISRNRMTYNLQGKRIRVENLAGQITTTAWDCCHKISESKPDGQTTTWDYDAEGRMIASSRLIPLDLTNVTWVTTCYAYDGLGRQTVTWTTNTTAHIGIPATTTSYDALGRVIARADVLGNATTTTYSLDGRTVSVRKPNGATVITTRNSDGDTLSITGTGVTPEFHTYGVLADGTRWTKTVQGETADSPRFTKSYENMLGKTIRDERSGFRGAVLSSVNTYDAYGRIVSTTSDGEPTNEITYDTFGNRIATTTLVGGGLRPPRNDGSCEWRKSESHSAYSLHGNDVWAVQTNVVSCSDATIAPLVQSRVERVTGLNSSLLSQSLSTDARGNVSESRVEYNGLETIGINISPAQTGRAESHSRLGVAVRSVSASGVESRSLYDGLGRLSTSVDGRGKITRTEYDAFGRQSARVDADNNRTTYGYNEFGELVAVTNALGDAVVYAYDLRGHKVYEGGATYPVSYSYDVFGNKVSMTTYRDFAATYTNWGCGIPSAPSGDTTRWLYDEASGSMTNKVYADGNGTKYEYDAHGRLTKRTWARGIDTTYTFNIWGLLARTDYSDSTPSVVLTYDAMGRQTRAVDAAGITTFAYDSFGSLTNETVVGVAGTNTIERFYDAFGRDAGYALNGVRQSTLGYDPATGRLASMQIPAIEDEQNHCPPPPLFSTFQWTYLEGSDLKSSLAYPNGLSASWTYDANNQLLQVKNAFDVAATPSPSQTNIISQYDYVYDAAGRRISVSKSGIAFDHADTIAYAYNTRSELTNAVASVDSAYRYAYGFDDIGNRETSFERGTNSVYAANQLNQYTAVDDFTPQFDDDGNQTLIKTSTGIWSVIYNGENRPVLWTCGDTHITMKFDRMGRRVEYLETVTSDEGGSQSLATATNAHHRFVYEGYLCIQRLNAAANNAIDLIFAWDPAEPVATRPLMIEKPGKCMLHVTHDGNKNVSDLVFFNGGSGVAAHYEYAPFGALTASTCNSTSNAYDYRTYNPFRFSSEYADDVLGLVYYNYRHYESTAGRWLSRDRVQMINEYRVIDNAPLGNIDVLGGATDRRRSCKCDKTKINCLGYAIGANYCVDPYTMSVDSLMESLKYKGSDVSDKECKCEACDKELVYVYIYINPGEFAELNAQVNIDLNKLPDEEVARLYRLFRQIFLEGHPNPLSEEDFWCSRDFGVDYHAMKKDCSDENGKWSYVSSRFNKGDVRAAPKELDSDSFFDNDYQVIAGKCYKKAKGK